MPRMFSEQKVKVLLKRESEVWIYSYADLITNLMAFFIVLLTLRSADQKTVEQLKESFAKVTAPAGIMGQSPDSEYAAVVSQYIANLPQKSQISVTKDTQGISLTFTGGLFFQTLDADLSPDAKAILETLAPILKKMPRDYRIEVGGHSDSRPVTDDSVYPTNWELSAARAAMVVRQLARDGVPARRMRAVGYADTLPVSSNMDQNRRVVIRVGKGISQ